MCNRFGWGWIGFVFKLGDAPHKETGKLRPLNRQNGRSNFETYRSYCKLMLEDGNEALYDFQCHSWACTSMFTHRGFSARKSWTSWEPRSRSWRLGLQVGRVWTIGTLKHGAFLSVMGGPLVLIHYRLGFSLLTIQFGVPPLLEIPVFKHRIWDQFVVWDACTRYTSHWFRTCSILWCRFAMLLCQGGRFLVSFFFFYPRKLPFRWRMSS